MEPEFTPLRALPQFDPDLVQRCREQASAMPLMFEWYKHVALVALDIASISIKQPGHIDRDSVHLGILRGLLNRCARLMLSTVKLAHDRKCGETVALLARCISESALKAQWLARRGDTESFLRFVGDAVRTDLKLRDLINANVAERGGALWVIEERMLRSVERVMVKAGVSEADAMEAKQLPNLYDICRDLGYHDTLYVSVQRIGSHAVHGTWSDLLFHYIDGEPDGSFGLRDNVESVPHSNHLLGPALLLLDTLRAHVGFIFDNSPLAESLGNYFDEIQRGILDVDHLARPEDFDPVPGKPPAT
jgi:hypothetical protein